MSKFKVKENVEVKDNNGNWHKGKIYNYNEIREFPYAIDIDGYSDVIFATEDMIRESFDKKRIDNKDFTNDELITLIAKEFDKENSNYRKILIQYLWTPESCCTSQEQETILYYLDEELTQEIYSINSFRNYIEDFDGFVESALKTIYFDEEFGKIEILLLRAD